MLRSITIENFALIKKMCLIFQQGMTVISGETGAGKSIIIQAISTLTGDMPSPDAIFSDCDRAVFEGVFSNDAIQDLKQLMQENDLSVECLDEICLRVELNRKTRNRFLVNDEAVSRSIFQKIGSALMDINSQHEHQRLLSEKHHLEMLDEALDLVEKKTAVAAQLEKVQESVSALKNVYQRLADAEKEKGVLMEQANEIDSAQLTCAEKTQLINELNVLRHQEEITRNIQQAQDILSGHGRNIASDMNQVIRLLMKIAQFDSSFLNLIEQATTAQLIVAELESILSSSVGFTADPSRLEQISERLHFLQTIEGNYKNSIEGILDYREKIRERLKELNISEADIAHAKTKVKQTYDKYMELAVQLSAQRRERSRPLVKKIISELALLGMDKARFEIEFITTSPLLDEDLCQVPEKCTASGIDRAAFLLSANPGIPVKPLALVASGGELSRIMLSLKQHLLSKNNKQTAVFDEIDAGIGGMTAIFVGRQLKKLSAHRQVICVTHLPQIAAFADFQFKVDKNVSQQETTIEIQKMEGLDREHELARMLGGMMDDPALSHARSLLKESQMPEPE